MGSAEMPCLAKLSSSYHEREHAGRVMDHPSGACPVRTKGQRASASIARRQTGVINAQTSTPQARDPIEVARRVTLHRPIRPPDSLADG